MLTLAACVVIATIGYDLWLGTGFTRPAFEALLVLVTSDYLWVGLIGFGVGAVELIARYRDDPQRAVRTPPAILYMFINVAACCATLYILNIVRPAWLFPKDALAADAGKNHLYLILSAGFGAVALFRSSIFKVKTNDGDLSVGPAVVLDTILNASDRAVDRTLAGPRGVFVAEIMKDVSFEKAKSALPVYCFALMQNVSHQEQKDIGDQVNSLATAAMNDTVRALNLGLALINVVGTKVLSSAVENLGDFIKGEPPIEQRDVAKIAELTRDLNYDAASIALPTYCLSLVSTVSAEAQAGFSTHVNALTHAQLPPRVKMLILGLAIANLVGYPVLRLAVEQLGADIQ